LDDTEVVPAINPRIGIFAIEYANSRTIVFAAA